MAARVTTISQKHKKGGKQMNENIIFIVYFLIISVFLGVILFEEHEITESLITYAIHNPDGTQTTGSIVYNDNLGSIQPIVTSSRGTSKLKAPNTILSSNGTIEIISVKPYRRYYERGPLSKHKRKR